MSLDNASRGLKFKNSELMKGSKPSVAHSSEPS